MAPFLTAGLAAGQAVLSWFASSNVPTLSHVPTVNLTLTPLFNATQHATALAVSLSIDARDVPAGDVLFALPAQAGNVPIFDGKGLHARDTFGSLELTVSVDPSSGLREWRTRRDSVGIVSWEFVAPPRIITSATLPGPRVDLRTDQGGLVGSGIYFLPLPPIDDSVLYDVRVDWKLESAPPNTRAVWTFGDGVHSTKRGSVSMLQNTYYAVGPVKAYTSKDGQFGLYWFGEPGEFDPMQMAIRLEKMFADMGAFYRKADESYRIFVRKSTAKSAGGTALIWSFMLEYDDYVTWAEEDDLLFLLAHEMVHNWPITRDRGETVGEGPAWWTEGIADYHATLLLYRFGIIDGPRFVRLLNQLTSGYYTSPVRNLSLEEAGRIAWTSSSPHAQRLPYLRGNMYFHFLRSQLANSTTATANLDDLVIELVRRRMSPKNELSDIETWHELLGDQLGEEVERLSFAAMSSGKWLIVPPADALGPCFTIVRDDQFVYERGFTLKQNVIMDLVPGSRAELAGLRDGDNLIPRRYTTTTLDNYLETVTARVQRKGEEGHMDIEYWPRGWEKVESWQWVYLGGKTCRV